MSASWYVHLEKEVYDIVKDDKVTARIMRDTDTTSSLTKVWELRMYAMALANAYVWGEQNKSDYRYRSDY